VGLPDKAVAESRERVRAALAALGLALPYKRITVNLAPADLLKEGSHFDLPIALGLLVAMGILPGEELEGYTALGELGLDGRLAAVAGVLNSAVHTAGHERGLICPAAQGGEAAWAAGIEVLAAPSLLALINHFKGSQVLQPPEPALAEAPCEVPDLKDIKGQETAKRALEATAAGGHNLLMIGPPGAGKSMLAQRLPGLLPPLDPAEALEVSMVHSVAGLLEGGKLLRRRPFRDPHHSASLPALIGGGTRARPGEVSLALLGVLFLAQLYFGPYLPGKLSHSGMSLERIIEFTFSTQEAMFGVVTATFATFVFPFMIFGAFLERSGAGRFFMQLATSLTGQWRGGPAKIATLSSALFGSISGSSVANVVASGAFTIPMMKRIGFKPHHAGGIEAIASTGGQIMPPIMGAGVFILATLTQRDYLSIAAMNLIPAVLFFLFVLLMVDLEAVRTGLKGLPAAEIPRVRDVLRRGWHFFVPLVVVIVELGRPMQVTVGATSGRGVCHPGGFVAGISDTFAVVEYAGHIRGVQVTLTPTGGRRLLGLPLSELQSLRTGDAVTVLVGERRFPARVSAIGMQPEGGGDADYLLEALFETGPNDVYRAGQAAGVRLQ